MAFANCVWDHFFACRPCWITFRMSEDTVFSRPASVCASSLAAFLLAPLWFAPPNFFIVSTFAPARLPPSAPASDRAPGPPLGRWLGGGGVKSGVGAGGAGSAGLARNCPPPLTLLPPPVGQPEARGAA